VKFNLEIIKLTDYNDEWVLSHFPVFSELYLHPQNNTVPDSVAIKVRGPMPEPAWFPSHKGCLKDFPHIQTWYSFPDSTRKE